MLAAGEIDHGEYRLPLTSDHIRQTIFNQQQTNESFPHSPKQNMESFSLHSPCSLYAVVNEQHTAHKMAVSAMEALTASVV